MCRVFSSIHRFITTILTTQVVRKARLDPACRLVLSRWWKCFRNLWNKPWIKLQTRPTVKGLSFFGRKIKSTKKAISFLGRKIKENKKSRHFRPKMNKIKSCYCPRLWNRPKTFSASVMLYTFDCDYDYDLQMSAATWNSKCTKKIYLLINPWSHFNRLYHSLYVNPSVTLVLHANFSTCT